MKPPTCRVTVWNPHAGLYKHSRTVRLCGQPVVAGRLCAHHEAERVRLTRETDRSAA